MKKKILIKISGELFRVHNQRCTDMEVTPSGFDYQLVHALAEQVKELSATYHVGFVIGGGNFFRGGHEGKHLKLRQSVADDVGMLATVMNGIILQECLRNEHVSSTLLSAVAIPGMVDVLSQAKIDQALELDRSIIFAGGTGNPFFTTDTNAIVRALQMGATQVWKATKVDAVYDDDPVKNPASKPIKSISFDDALRQNLRIMDMTALTLAQENQLTIRVFNLFAPQALLNVAQNNEFGSTIFPTIR